MAIGSGGECMLLTSTLVKSRPPQVTGIATAELSGIKVNSIPAQPVADFLPAVLDPQAI